METKNTKNTPSQNYINFPTRFILWNDLMDPKYWPTYLYLLYNRDSKTHECRISTRKIQKALRIGQSTAYRSIRLLKEIGAIKIIKTQNNTVYFFFPWDENYSKAKEEAIKAKLIKENNTLSEEWDDSCLLSSEKDTIIPDDLDQGVLDDDFFAADKENEDFEF